MISTIDKTGAPEKVLYTCVAPNYLKEIVDESGMSMDYIKEECCSSLKKCYTRKQIKKMSDFGFDLWKGLVCVDHKKLYDPYSIILLGEKYRLTPEFPNLRNIKEALKYHIKSRFDVYSFYSKKAIILESKRAGRNLFAIGNWQKYIEKKIFKAGEERGVIFYESM